MALFVSLQNRLASLRKEEGQAMVEYGIILALIAVVLIATLVLLEDQLTAAFTYIKNQIDGATPNPSS
jgi:pilus assembly protein Flp/PilA